jgi:DNA-binding GntR family transcriptional regulator
VRRAIISGDLHPGQRLREVAPATELGVSRPTLREALRTLAQEGLCEQEPHRGFAVARLDAGALLDLSEKRVVLDRMAVEGIWAGGDSAMQDAEDAWSAYIRAGTDPVEHTSRSAEELVSLRGE